MSARGLLLELLDLIRHQTEAIIAGDAQAIQNGVARHEQLLAELQVADVDGTPEELRTLIEHINAEKAKLQSLLSSESVRVDFLLRLILGGGAAKGLSGYPGAGLLTETNPSMLNRRA